VVLTIPLLSCRRAVVFSEVWLAFLQGIGPNHRVISPPLHPTTFSPSLSHAHARCRISSSAITRSGNAPHELHPKNEKRTSSLTRRPETRKFRKTLERPSPSPPPSHTSHNIILSHLLPPSQCLSVPSFRSQTNFLSRDPEFAHTKVSSTIYRLLGPDPVASQRGLDCLLSYLPPNRYHSILTLQYTCFIRCNCFLMFIWFNLCAMHSAVFCCNTVNELQIELTT